ncbi:MAG: twin-arginine translocase TatA/TatE family subunit [Firmicutes bacterium]|nr:twin-arginine translocase TatA/TatE family subunit [Bacillota bacterium]
MFGIGATELVIILVLALIIFGPGKLPEVGKAIGKGIREFKRATSAAADDEETKPASAAAGGDRAVVRKDDVPTT